MFIYQRINLDQIIIQILRQVFRDTGFSNQTKWLRR